MKVNHKNNRNIEGDNFFDSNLILTNNSNIGINGNSIIKKDEFNINDNKLDFSNNTKIPKKKKKKILMKIILQI